MPRDKEYESNAERQKAYRERKLSGATNATPSGEWESFEPADAKTLYVETAMARAREDAQSRAQSRTIARGLNKDLEEIDIEARVERAKAYAAWRWDAHLAGEVASL